MKFDSKKKTYRTFSMIFVIFLVIATAIVFVFINHRKNVQWLKHSYNIQISLETLHSLLKDAETGQRGYLITGVRNYLDPYHFATDNIRQQFVNLYKLTRFNPDQHNRLPYLDKKITAKVGELDYTITQHEKEGFDAAKLTVLSDRGKKEMDEIRQIITEMHDAEHLLMQTRMQKENDSLWLLSGLASLLLAVVTVNFYLLINCVRMQHTRNADLKKSLDKMNSADQS